MESVKRVVVESLMSDFAPVVHLDKSPVTDEFAPLNPQESQVSHLSSVQLSPKRVRLDFDIATPDVFPMLAAGEIDWEHPGIHRGNLITCAGSERVTDRVCSIK